MNINRPLPLEHRPTSRGFTMIELLSAVAIVAILATLLFAISRGVRKRAERVQCGENMKTLHMALQNYLVDHKRWPQVNVDTEDEKDYWQSWVEVLAEYDLPDEVWMCPSHKRVTRDEFLRYSSYHPMPFDGKSQFTPYRWKMPWVVEIGDNHGKGPLIIMHDGSIREADYTVDYPNTTLKKR